MTVLPHLLLCAALIGAAVQEKAAAPRAQDLPQLVERLVAELDADQLRTRLQAEARLLELGPAILPLLPDDQTLEGPALRVKVLRVRRELERRKGDDALQASVVTLSGSMSLQEVVVAIRDQTSNTIELDQLPAGRRADRIDARWNEARFWDVVGDLEAKFRIRCVSTGSGIGLVAASPGIPPVARAVSGPFRFSVETGSRRPLQGDPQAARDLIRVPVSVCGEPRLRGLFVLVRSDQLQLAVQRGPLAPFSPGSSLEIPLGQRGASAQWSIDATIPKKDSAESVSLGGDIVVVAAASDHAFAFRDLSRGLRARRTHAGVTVRLDDAQSDPENRTAQISLTVNWTGTRRAFESHRTWVYHNAAWLESAEGTRVDYSGPVRTAAQAGGAVRLSYRFEGLATALADYRFVYEAPTLIREVNVPVELLVVPVVADAGAR